VQFPQALALMRQWRGLPPLLHETAGFYRMQLHRHGEAVAYLYQRGPGGPVNHWAIIPLAAGAISSAPPAS